MVQHVLTFTELQEIRDILRHIAFNPDLLVNAAATRHISVIDAYIALVEDIHDVESRIALVVKQEGV